MDTVFIFKCRKSKNFDCLFDLKNLTIEKGISESLNQNWGRSVRIRIQEIEEGKGDEYFC
jgi:hypothetical protein